MKSGSLSKQVLEALSNLFLTGRPGRVTLLFYKPNSERKIKEVKKYLGKLLLQFKKVVDVAPEWKDPEAEIGVELRDADENLAKVITGHMQRLGCKLSARMGRFITGNDAFIRGK